MTLEETIKQATPLGGVYQHACPGGWTAYAAKSESGLFAVSYAKNSDPVQIHEYRRQQVYDLVIGGVN